MFKLDVDTLNECRGGEGIRYSLETGEGEYSSEIKKIPKAKSRFRLKFLNERIEESLEPV